MIPSLVAIGLFVSAAPPTERFNPLVESPGAGEVRRAAPPAPVKVTAAGWHVHRCPAGHEWSQTDASYGNRADHTCPLCGRVEWNVAQRNVRIVTPQPRQPPVPPPSSRPASDPRRFNPLAIDAADPMLLPRMVTLPTWCPPGRT